jgi:hypothetical protein
VPATLAIGLSLSAARIARPGDFVVLS